MPAAPALLGAPRARASWKRRSREERGDIPHGPRAFPSLVLRGPNGSFVGASDASPPVSQEFGDLGHLMADRWG